MAFCMRNLLLSLVCLGLLAPQAQAGLVVYTDRADFYNALSATATLENFNALLVGTSVNQTSDFSSGIVIEPTETDVTRISDFAFGALGLGNGLLTFNDVTITFPSRVLAFAFDFADVDHDGAAVTFGTFNEPLPFTGDADDGITADDFGFFGVVADTPDEIPERTVQLLTLGSLEGVVIDNLTFLPAPEPAAHLLLLMGLAAMLAWARRRSIS